MAVSGFILGLLTVFVATLYMLYCYGNVRKQHIIVTVATLVSWYFSFIIIFILPLDVSSTAYNQCKNELFPSTVITSTTTTTALPNSSNSMILDTFNTVTNGTLATTTRSSVSSCVQPWTYLSENTLASFWKVVYWSSQILTWLVLPMMQSYANAGEFTVLGKIKSALIANAIFYGTYILIFVVCLIYVATKPDIQITAANLKVIGITASNTWGLFLLVLLFGYGLVDIPRSVWNDSKPGYTLHQTYFKIAKLSTECSEAQEQYEDALEEVRKTAESIKYNHPFRQYIDTILEKCPEDFRRSLRRNDDYVDYNEENRDIPTPKALTRLHINVISAVRNYHRTQCQRKHLIKSALHLEDVAANQASTNHYFKRTQQYEGYLKLIYSPRIEWWWKCLLRPIFLKIVAILLALMSVMVVWSECLFFIQKPVLSLFAIFINLGRDHLAYVSIELACVMVIAYLSVCAYYTVFKVRVFNYYYIASNHQTDENSLLFSGMLLCRLTPPLCLNFLSLIHLDSHVTSGTNLAETAYTKIMGHMDVISFIADGFNIYFPIAILLLCIATLAKLGSRLLHCIGFEQFIGDDDMTQELIDEGMNLVKREKRKFERDRDATARRDGWNKMLAGQTGSAASQAAMRQQRANDSDASSSSQTKRYGTEREVRATRGTTGTSDRTELLSDQDSVEYNPSEVSSRFDYQPSRNKPPSRMFDDL